ncbi:phage major capsid protein [Priestia megaterium]|uniref:phage major capsid protein n=1 Tax=Priestia megaterium TaxID=1404 RepID=UPI00207A9C3E|nr:phage major capsid protein [Priestia megaterium]USL25095.1 phage major capsid protein [Priestia megaterium]
MKMELRVQNAELRSSSDGSMTVSGYVNKTEQLSETLGVTKRFKEKIAKGAFTQAIKNASKDIHFLAEHNNKQILASTRNGSLQLKEDSQGLWMSATIAPTSWGKDYYELIKSGIYQNMSFGFRTISDSWKSIEQGLFERTITGLELIEVSVVRDPAYSQSTIAARSIEIVEEPEVKDVEEVRKEFNKDLELEIRKVQIEIEKQKSHVSNLESFVAHSTNGAGKSTLKRELEKLEEKKRELSELKKEHRKQEEQKMEERNLQGTTEGQSTISQQVAPIAELLESTSPVFAKARKIKLQGINMKLPYETAFEDASFVIEGEDIPEINLNLSQRTELTPKRVGAAQTFSNMLLNDVGDLDEHSKSLLIRRVGKAVEEGVLAGDGVKQPHGIAGDSNVIEKPVSVNPTAIQLRQLYLAIHEEFVKSASFYMSRPFFEQVALLTDDNGEYLVRNERVDGKVIPTLWNHPIEVSPALAAGDNMGEVPVIFADIASTYTLAIAQDINFVKLDVNTTNAKQGSTAFKVDMELDGAIHQYQAVAKGVVA